ncbi:hypothetical protein GQ55_9G133800 [Panicum hallii var. hallii]|uniref:VAN3-binding protein-like auxin canalisation domain-containing protein n=1 Tax=Panicum hallii var. hallii TaxID=1504633 RepID=A0A2T7C2Q1_9POAL|nr:hypothetical protein GQ55_9G133800 [Panicum hallii var. hallii]
MAAAQAGEAGGAMGPPASPKARTHQDVKLAASCHGEGEDGGQKKNDGGRRSARAYAATSVAGVAAAVAALVAGAVFSAPQPEQRSNSGGARSWPLSTPSLIALLPVSFLYPHKFRPVNFQASHC